LQQHIGKGKAEAWLLERTVYDLNKKEWRELIAGIPADVDSVG